MTNDKQKPNINKFLLSIQNMIESKYILIDRRISDILLSIAENDAIYNLIAECMINFDFREEWKRATDGQFFKFPENESKRIAFIFCMLNNIDDRNIDITNVLEKYFSYDLGYTPYDMFCKTVIVEFKRLVMKFLNIVEISNQAQAVESVIVQEPLLTDNYKKLADYLRELVKFLSSLKKIKGSFMPKYDLIAVVSTFEQVVRNKQVEYFYAFLVTLNSALPKNKDIKFMMIEINRLTNNLIARG